LQDKTRRPVSSNRPSHQNINQGVADLRQSIADSLFFRLAKEPTTATLNDWYLAVAFAVRERMTRAWTDTSQSFTEDTTILAFLSPEFLIGPQLGIHLLNLGIRENTAAALKELGLSLQDILDHEEEPGLGNGGTARLAACFIDSASALGFPCIAYGIRYEVGPFLQKIRDGWQVETTRKWLMQGNPWEILRPDISYTIKMGGRTESGYERQSSLGVRWTPKFAVRGVAYDMPVSGYSSGTVNTLRLWKAQAAESFDFESFHSGDYLSSLNEKISTESISKILYAEDEPYAGKHMRLAQQYFFISCSLQDMIRMHLLRWKNINEFSSSYAIHLNGVQAAIGVAELMRLLVDEHMVPWDKAWCITQNTFSYTSHAFSREAMEKWPLSLFADILPRHAEIVHEINRRFLNEISEVHPFDNERLSELSLIDGRDQKYVRIGHLGGIGSHAIAGLGHDHSESVKDNIFTHLSDVYPGRFFSCGAGVNHRRWISLINPRLSTLITEAIGNEWLRDFAVIARLGSFASDAEFLKKWRRIRHQNKHDLAAFVGDATAVPVNPGSLFDVQIKRFHEQKRQHLNILHILTLFNRLKKNPDIEITPRTFIFGGTASPGYFTANLLVKLVNSVGAVLNNDADVAGRLRVVFFPDFNVRTSRWIYPAADLSEQISQAGREVLGTGSMKYAMNGALTIGTPGGANGELFRALGEEAFYIFGQTPEEIAGMKEKGYDPALYRDVPELNEAVELISSGLFSPDDPGLFKPLVDSLLCRDEYMVLPDFRSYIDCQDRIGEAFKMQEKWTRISIEAVSKMGSFSSDGSVREYNDKIWHAQPLKKARINCEIEGGAGEQ
jgi:glycogen phosphorylase